MNEHIDFTSPHRGYLEQRKARVLKVAAADPELTPAQLERRFGVTASNIAEWLKAAGLARPHVSKRGAR